MWAGPAVFGAFAVYMWSRRTTPGAAALIFILAAGIWYTTTYALELGTTALHTKQLWGDIKYVGVTMLPPAWLAFTLQYSGRTRWLTRRRVLWLAVEPLAVLVMLAIPGAHDLVRFYPASSAGQRFPVVALGPVGWLNVVYSYGLLLVGTGLFVLTLTRIARPYRRLAGVLVAVLMLPFVLNVVYIFNIGPFGKVDLTAFAFVVATSVIVWGLMRLRLVDIVPVARNRIVETLQEGVVVLDAYERVVDLNPAASRTLGRTASRTIGLEIGEVIPGYSQLDTGPTGLVTSHAEMRLGSDAGSRLYEVSLSPITDDRGRASGKLLVLRDISERKIAEERLEHLAHYDSLTGLPNRKLFGDRLSQAIIRARRSGKLVGLLFLDLDNFKDVNDTLGHDGGDMLLEQFAVRLQSCVRAEDTVARLGGDEFTVILPEVRAPQDAVTVAAHIFDVLRQTFVVRRHEFHVSASIGVCLWPTDGHDPRTLVQNADVAMYRAKARGRNRYEFYATHLGVHTAKRLELEQDIRRALERSELCVLYQPIVSVATRVPVAMEALVRWYHPEHGLLGPSHFMWRAEETDLVERIGQWVLEEGCREARGWMDRSKRQPDVAVNVAARQLRRSGFAAEVADVLDRTGLAPDRLVLEISEDIVMDDPLTTAATLHELSILGVKLSLDDFGTGATSLSQLPRLPFDILKIGRLFIQDLHANAEDAIVVQAMISLAHALNRSVVAEGVELAEQMSVLERLGCDLVQGFLFSRPVPPESIPNVLLGDAWARAAASANESPRSIGYPILYEPSRLPR
jgi:diguanylate cyclase (GGDEF)-like protein/PAS domain S-box-containing protein